MAGGRERERERRYHLHKETCNERNRDREGKERREREQKRGGKRDWDRRGRENLRGHADRDYGSSSDEIDDMERDRKRQRRDRDREQSSTLQQRRDMKEATRGEEEQRKLDEKKEKRLRRVQEWQELRRKREEIEREALEAVGGNAEESSSGNTLALEGEDGFDGKTNVDESLDGEDDIAVDSESRQLIPAAQNDASEEEIDPLDAYMNSVVLPEVEKLHNETPESEDMNTSMEEKNISRGNGGEQPKKCVDKSLGRIIASEDSDSDYYQDNEGDEGNEDDAEFMKRVVKKSKAEKLTIVDHSKIEYPPFRKNFFNEVKEISNMTSQEVAAYRKQLELKIHGKDVPKPIKAWHQTGLSTKIMKTIKKLNYEKPMPIQAQALPVIMSGRDCISVAKTGSGKTLAFVLPMLRHIKDQPPLMPGDGPIGLIMAPTRELVQQIHSDSKKFARILGLHCVPVYGGSSIAQQISKLKRGAEIVVCTPGRMIDILCTGAGKITNLRRVTYLVMDEADRLFDMGFEPQITKMVQNIQPDCQTVLFSATFPRQVEILARKVLNKPVEIQVGGRSVVNKDITQLVEVRAESNKFLRLLEILGEWYNPGKILIFVNSRQKCDSLFRDLFAQCYPCLSLHGAMDQTDRESTIADFKSNVCNLLIATSVAARGLDVKELQLVINFDAPNHYEEYVHRVGRTGRAGQKGCAITFISEDDARYAPDLVKALELSEQIVPDDLRALADGFMAKVNQGLEQAHGTGYGGSGFKYNEEEDEVRKVAKKAQAKEYGFEEDESDSDDDDVTKNAGHHDLSQRASAAEGKPTPPISTSQQVQVQVQVQKGALPSIPGNDAATLRTAALTTLAKIEAENKTGHCVAELEINDFPQNARWKVTHRETLGPISELTGAAVTVRGKYISPGRTPAGEQKLFLFIEGPTEQSVTRAKDALRQVLEDITTQSDSAQSRRY